MTEMLREKRVNTCGRRQTLNHATPEGFNGFKKYCEAQNIFSFDPHGVPGQEAFQHEPIYRRHARIVGLNKNLSMPSTVKSKARVHDAFEDR